MRAEVFVHGGVYYVTETCYKCGTPFAMTREYQQQRYKDRADFHCPNGHPQHYIGKTEADKLREEVERQRQQREAAEARTARVTQERDQVARAHHRMRERVMNGVCPCCNRTFQNLLRHMKTEHEGEFSLRHLRQVFGMTQAAVAHEIGVSQAAVSSYERGRPVAGYAKEAIDRWVDRQAPQDAKQ